MKWPGNARQRWLAFALAGSLAMTGWTWRRQSLQLSEAVVRPAPAPSTQPAPSTPTPTPTASTDTAAPVLPAAPPPVSPAADVASPDATADPFAVTQWEPPPPPAPPPPPPPPEPVAAPPTAPPLPFRYLGRQQLATGPASTVEVYLARDSAALAVRPGERIGDDYRFDGDDGQGTLRFVYLPLGTPQTLFIGEEK